MKLISGVNRRSRLVIQNILISRESKKHILTNTSMRDSIDISNLISDNIRQELIKQSGANNITHGKY